MTLDSDKIKEVVLALGFLSDKVSPTESSLYDELVKSITGGEKDWCSLLSLKVFLSAIMNFNSPWMKAEQEEKPAPEEVEGE